jgi:hypothetical protein
VSLLFFEHQGNDLLRAKGVVILDTGHHLTFHPTDMQFKVYTVYIEFFPNDVHVDIVSKVYVSELSRQIVPETYKLPQTRFCLEKGVLSSLFFIYTLLCIFLKLISSAHEWKRDSGVSKLVSYEFYF